MRGRRNTPRTIGLRIKKLELTEPTIAEVRSLIQSLPERKVHKLNEPHTNGERQSIGIEADRELKGGSRVVRVRYYRTAGQLEDGTTIDAIDEKLGIIEEVLLAFNGRLAPTSVAERDALAKRFRDRYVAKPKPASTGPIRKDDNSRNDESPRSSSVPSEVSSAQPPLEHVPATLGPGESGTAVPTTPRSHATAASSNPSAAPEIAPRPPPARCLPAHAVRQDLASVASHPDDPCVGPRRLYWCALGATVLLCGAAALVALRFPSRWLVPDAKGQHEVSLDRAPSSEQHDPATADSRTTLVELLDSYVRPTPIDGAEK